MMKGVIFDFDGVIVDTERSKFRNLKNLLSKRGYSLPKSSFSKMVGRKTYHFIKEQFPEISETEINEIVKLRHKNLSNSVDKPIEGVIELIKSLYAHKIGLALVTGSKRSIVEPSLTRLKLKKYFSWIITGEDFSSSKPDAECYNLTLNKMNMKPSEVTVIEDSVAGVQSAHNAGLQVIGLGTYLDNSSLKADKYFTTPLEVNNYLSKRI